jgi:hypothetical protein
MGVCGQRQATAALPPGRRPGNHFTGGWVGPRVVVDGSEKCQPHQDFSVLFCNLCFIRTCFFVFNVLYFVFLSLLKTHNTNIHAPGGIRTPNPSTWAATPPRLRPLGHLDHGRFSPRETDPVPILQEAGWVPGPVWMGLENVNPTRLRSPDPCDSLTIRYTDCALSASTCIRFVSYITTRPVLISV